MAVRRTRPPQPIAPHGIPGHLVEFVEALRGAGISVGTVRDRRRRTGDLDRSTSATASVLREGLACACCSRPDHRETYDALFDLWLPAALGARTAVPTTRPTASGEARRCRRRGRSRRLRQTLAEHAARAARELR